VKCSIVWLRRDLRLADNPALHHAIHNSDRVIPVYIHAPDEERPWQPGAASNWWCHHSLLALQEEIKQLGGRLIIRRGPSEAALLRLCDELQADAVYWNHEFIPQLTTRDEQIRRALLAHGINQYGYNGSLLYTPGAILNQERKPYRVFSAFWQACQKQGFGDTPLPTPKRLDHSPVDSLSVTQLELLPAHDWHIKLAEHWQPGEAAALQSLQRLRCDLICGYAKRRDYPAIDATSRLSPQLAFGEVSPRQVVTALLEAFISCKTHGQGCEGFIRELGWREFAYHTLHHFPRMSERPIDARFEQFAWRDDETVIRAWQRGETGYPIIDAGMRQLWQTGWMHNRVRMIVASFLAKNGLIHWLAGARWFWDTLVDADLANNSFNWQWVAGCGLDAAPYFRIFNPTTQSEKFDPNGDYIRSWIPQLARLPTPWIHKPWQAPTQLLQQAGINIGDNYPNPLLNLAATRERALTSFKQLRLNG